MLSTLPAAAFGPGPEAAADGCAAGLAADFGPGGGCGSLRGALSWTGGLLSTPLAANFGPGQDGGAAGRGICFIRLSPPTSGLGRRGRRRGAQLDWEFAFYTSRRRRRAWPGDDNGGVRDWTGNRFVRLSVSPTSGQALRRRRRGAQLDGEFASTPLAVDFGPI